MYSPALSIRKAKKQNHPSSNDHTSHPDPDPSPTNRNQSSLEKWLITGRMQGRCKMHVKYHIVPKRKKVNKRMVRAGQKGAGARLKGLPLAKSKTTSIPEQYV